MKQMLKGLSDKASNYLDTKGLANPVEVINEELGGETREESRKRREAAREPKKMAVGGKVKSPTMTYQTYTKTGKKAGMKTIPVTKMAKGGTASSRADGCAIRGKTKGKLA